MTPGFTDQLTVSAVIVFGLQILKKSEWFPWITHQTDKTNRLLAVGLAGLAAIGIHFSFDTVAGVLTISGLKLGTILNGGWAWLQSFATQEFVYRASAKKVAGDTGIIARITEQHHSPEREP